MYERRGNSVSFLNFRTYLPPRSPPALSLCRVKVFLVCFADPGRIIQHLFPRPCFCLCTSRASLLRSYILTFELHRQFIALTLSRRPRGIFRFVMFLANITRFVPRYYPFSVHSVNISSQFAAQFWDKRETFNLIVTVRCTDSIIQPSMYRSHR